MCLNVFTSYHTSDGRCSLCFCLPNGVMKQAGKGRRVGQAAQTRCFISFKIFNYWIKFKISCLFLDFLCTVCILGIFPHDSINKNTVLLMLPQRDHLKEKKFYHEYCFLHSMRSYSIWHIWSKILHLSEILKVCVVFTVKYINALLFPFHFLGI